MDGMGWGGREIQKGGVVCAHIADSLTVQQKPTEHCKTTIPLQKKKKKATRIWASQLAPVVKNPYANARDSRDAYSIPGSGRCPGEGNGTLLQYLCLDNSMERGVWWAAKSWT